MAASTSPTTDHLGLVLAVARADAELRRGIDGPLSSGHGLSLGDLTLLWHLQQAPGRQLRRVDLADRVGLSASGVTRSLAPLERIGLVDRRSNPNDARVALAVLTATGDAVTTDALATAGASAEAILTARLSPDDLATLATLVSRLVPPR